MPVFENNRELLEGFKRGDRGALTAVYERYVDEVAALIRRGFTMESHGLLHIAGARDADAEHDLIQKTFINAFSERARMSYDGLRPYRPYLLRITKNLMIDRLRAKGRMVEVDQQGGGIDGLLEANAELHSDQEPEHDLHWKELLRATSEFLGELNPESRQFVQLRFEEELSQDQVAERVGCSRRRVRTLEKWVQKGLQVHLGKRGLLAC
jgi:RNA polymerase sigma factor (sigma-70 family)